MGGKEISGKLSLEVGQERPFREKSVDDLLAGPQKLEGHIPLGRSLVLDTCWELWADYYT